MYADRLFEIWGLGPNLYGIMIALGLVCCFLMLSILGKRIGMERASLDFYEMTGIAAVALGFLSATIFQYFYDLIKYGSASFGNMTFLGGLIGGVLTFMLITKFFAKPEVKKDIFKLLQIAMPCILIAHAFGRLGCFFAGCCYGIETDGPLGIVFRDGSSSGSVLPTQLFEAVFLFILFAITVLFVYKKVPYNVVIYAVTYSVFRFTLEFFRGDSRGEIMPGISPSQFWCIFMFILGIGLLVIMVLYRNKEKLPNKLNKLAAGFSDIYKKETSPQDIK